MALAQRLQSRRHSVSGGFRGLLRIGAFKTGSAFAFDCSALRGWLRSVRTHRKRLHSYLAIRCVAQCIFVRIIENASRSEIAYNSLILNKFHHLPIFLVAIEAKRTASWERMITAIRAFVGAPDKSTHFPSRVLPT